jgi:hypothetical protein
VGVFVQVGTAGSGLTIALPIAPKNGDRVTILAANSTTLAAVTCLDSNLAALTQQLSAGNLASTEFVAIYDYVVSGSPTATYTFSTSILNFAIAYELAEITAGLAMSATATNAVVSIAQGTLLPGTLQLALCMTGTAGATLVPTFTNGVGITDVTSTQQSAGHARATSENASTVSFNTGTSGSIVAGSMTYPSTGGGEGSGGEFPFMGVYPGGMPGMT